MLDIKTESLIKSVRLFDALFVPFNKNFLTKRSSRGKNEILSKYFKRSSSNEDEIKKLRQENDELIKIINERNLVTNDRGTFLSIVVQFVFRLVGCGASYGIS